MEGNFIKSIKKSEKAGFDVFFCDNTMMHSNAPTEEMAAYQCSPYCPKPCPVD